MVRYIVRFGDTLWSIAERCYGDGQLWSFLADQNPEARAGVLYEGQCLELPLPARPRSLADAYRHATSLGHAPVKIRLEGTGPLFRYDGFGVFCVHGFVGELTFHRLGNLHLGDLSVSRLLLYRLEQIAWARGLFLEHFSPARVIHRDSIPWTTGTNVTREPIHRSGPGYTITGRIGFWWSTNVLRVMAGVPTTVRMSLTMNLPNLFDSATLVLGELPAPLDAPPGQSVPLGRVLRAACPHLISPSELWALTRDETCFMQPQPATNVPAQEVDVSVPPPEATKQKKTGRKGGRKKRHVAKPATKQARPRKSQKG